MPRLRFGIAGLMMLTLVVGVVAAAGYHFYLGDQGERSNQLLGILITVAGPVLLVIVFSVFHAVARWLDRRR